jgi:hypothetical protein
MSFIDVFSMTNETKKGWKEKNKGIIDISSFLSTTRSCLPNILLKTAVSTLAELLVEPKSKKKKLLKQSCTEQSLRLRRSWPKRSFRMLHGVLRLRGMTRFGGSGPQMVNSAYQIGQYLAVLKNSPQISLVVLKKPKKWKHVLSL